MVVFLLYNLQEAEIVSDRYTSSYGYYLDKPSEMIGNTEYTHNTRVDGNNAYGTAEMSFPRRTIVCGGHDYSTHCGSRCIYSRLSTGYTNHWISIRQRLVVLVMVEDIGY